MPRAWNIVADRSPGVTGSLCGYAANRSDLPTTAPGVGAGASPAEPAGTLHAIVELTGGRPEALPSGDSACTAAPPFTGKDGRLAGAFVEITSVRGARPARAAAPVIVVQRPCDFSPPLVALALNEVPIDVLAEREGTTRGAIYKTLHDARRKLRAHLEESGHAVGGHTEERS